MVLLPLNGHRLSASKGRSGNLLRPLSFGTVDEDSIMTEYVASSLRLVGRDHGCSLAHSKNTVKQSESDKR